MSNEPCSLCSLALPKRPLVEGEHAFCCSGCLTVFRILTAKGVEGNFETQPLFQQALEAGVLSHPDLYKTKPLENVAIETLHLQIEEMWCPSCAKAIELILLRQKGVQKVVVDYATDLALIEYAPRYLSKEDIFRKISRLGYHPCHLLEEERSKKGRGWIRFALSVFCTMNLMMFATPLYFRHMTEGYGHAFGWLSFALSLPLMTYCAWPIWRRFATAMRARFWGMETLVMIGVSSIFLYSTYHLFQGNTSQIYYESMGMILTFVLLGKQLEKKAKFSAKESLFRLTRTLPKKGCKQLSDGTFAYIPIKEIARGDLLRARTGEKIVLDGSVAKGEGLVDEAILTGEAMPVRKKEGDSVTGGSLVKQGPFTYTVTNDIENTLLSKVTQLIESDFIQKRSGKHLVDRLIFWFVPFVLLLALCALPFGTALPVLLVACPCALGIAAPLAEALLLNRFAEYGALVRNRNVLPLLAKDPFFVFDKTGTLTEGKFRVQKGLEALSEKEQAILRGLASQSSHPISVAVSEAIQVDPSPLESVREVVGRGIEGVYKDVVYRFGSPVFTKQLSLASEETLVYFNSHPIYLGDCLRAHLPNVPGGVLSGDNPVLVASVAEKCGYAWGKGGCDPLEKREEIERLKGDRPIVMVGDGVNDAPALSAADVGISVVSATDLSIEASDILLTRDRLNILPELCHLAKRGERTIKQNLFWAFSYNAIALGLAFSGVLNPLIAVSAMLLSSLFVLGNSLLLIKS